MSRQKGKKGNRERTAINIQSSNSCFSNEEMIEIYSESYYKALKRIEEEKTIGKEEKKISILIKILYMLNFFIWPFYISKKFQTHDSFADGILVVLLSWIFSVAGIGLWGLSLVWIIVCIVCVCEHSITLMEGCIGILLGVLLDMFGGMLWQANKEIFKETDSTKIHMCTGSFMAILGVIVAIISLVVTIG